MPCRKTIAGLVIAGFVLAAPGATWAQDAHSDADAHPSACETHTLSLNQGEKWETDAPLRQGITGIRTAMAEASDKVDSGALTPEGYDELAASVEGEVNYMIENCELPAEADAQLHILLEQILGGVEQIRASSDSAQEGTMDIAEALGAYERISTTKARNRSSTEFVERSGIWR